MAVEKKDDQLVIGGKCFDSRLSGFRKIFSGTDQGSRRSTAGAQMITLALRRANEGGAGNILDYIPGGSDAFTNTSELKQMKQSVSQSFPERSVVEIL